MKIKQIKGNRKAWTLEDRAAVIELYNTFLFKQRDGTAYTKAASVRELAARLGRSKGSIECKLMNVSAVRVDLGYADYVTGYKPLKNYEKALFLMVQSNV